jgi:hypothetical protein
MSRHPRPPSKLEIVRWVASYQKGASINDIARMVERSPSFVYKRLQQAGVRFRPPGAYYTKIDPKMEQLIKRKRRQGVPPADLAVEFKVSRQWIYELTKDVA